MSEEGASAAAELHLYAKAYGKTPAEALRDPDFEFNIEVMRGFRKARQVALDMAKNDSE